MESLLPVRHPERDFFTCNIFDALPCFKDDMASMEHPIFSLSTKPDMRSLYYEHNGKTIEITPSGIGLATIHDKDILLYCASYLRNAISNGHQPSKRIRFAAYDLLVSTNRLTNGRSYERLKSALVRLRGTTITTNIKTGGQEVTNIFGLIDSAGVVKEDESRRIIAAEIEASDWFYNAVLSNELLTINKDYFRIRKPMERRIYEIARKHCGDQPSFKVGLDKLHKKIGTNSPLKKFRFQIKGIAETNHLPDYEISFSDDVVTFTNRNARKQTKDNNAEQYPLPLLKPVTFEKAREVAPGWDIYALESEWRDWANTKTPPKRPDAAFIAFCRKKAGRTR
jgi:plasmid replication initiation protein